MPVLTIDPDGDLEIVLTHPESSIRQFIESENVSGAPQDDGAIKPKRLSKKEHKNKKRHSRRLLPLAEEDISQITLALTQGLSVEEDLPIEEPTQEGPVVEGLPHDLNDLEINGEKHIGCNSTSPSGHIGSDGLRLLVSSKHLSLASSIFHTMLGGPWLEGSKAGLRTIRASDFNAQALVIVLDIMHGQHSAMPQTVDLELLANIACVVDYYNCHEVVEPFVDQWIKMLEPNLPTVYGRQCMLWMSISWVFLRETALISMTHLAVVGCRGHVDDMGLPLPHILLRRIEQKRVNMIEGLLLALKKLWNSLTEENCCSPGCSFMLLGALTSHMKKAGIFSPLKDLEAYSHSIEGLHKQMLTFDSPMLRASSYNSFGSFAECSCRLQTRIKPLVDVNRRLLETLALEDIYEWRLQKRKEARQTALALRLSWLPLVASHPEPGDDNVRALF